MSFSILYFSRAWSLNGVYRVSEVGKVRVSVRYRACAKYEVVAEYVFTNIRNTKIENHLSKCEVGKYLSYMKWTVLIRNEVFQLVHETSAQYKHSVEARCLASVELIDSNPWSALEITSKLHRRKKSIHDFLVWLHCQNPRYSLLSYGIGLHVFYSWNAWSVKTTISPIRDDRFLHEVLPWTIRAQTVDFTYETLVWLIGVLTLSDHQRLVRKG